MEMRLLLTFALAFVLPAQQDNKDNPSEESMENGNEMMTKVLDALSEKHTMEIINALNKNDVEKFTDCMEDECKMADFVDLMEKILYFFKGESHGDKLIYDLIKALVKHGPLAELVKELSEELTLEVINALTSTEIGKLMNIGGYQINIFALLSIGKKIIPIIKKANGGQGVPKLISTFSGGDGSTEDDIRMLEKIVNALSEEDTMKMVNAFSAHDVEKLTNCLEGECNRADSVTLMEKMLNVLKGISHGDKLIYNLIKELFKYGPLAELVNGLSEEYILEIINTLNGRDIDALMNIGKSRIEKFDIVLIGKKIIPIIKKANGGKGVPKLISMFTDDEARKTDASYYQPVPGGLHPGMSVYMQGTLPVYHNRSWVNFQVDFTCGQHNGADVPLRFRFHINAETVGLNTLQGGRWGKEEKCPNLFQNSKQFEVILIVHHFGYQVLINKQDLCNYVHRIPPQNVQAIMIDGDLEHLSLSVVGGPVMTLPYNQPVSSGCHFVYVEGTVPRNARSFRVDLAYDKFKKADILLHFNPRFSQGQVVLNTFHSGRWGDEEKFRNPFQKGEHFELVFMVYSSEFRVLVNGILFWYYDHRILPQFLKYVNLDGNLELQTLTIVGRRLELCMMFRESVLYYPPVPYVGDIPGGLVTNRTITVRGSIPENATRFEINLMAGQNIALHFSARIKPWRGMVCNTRLNGKWGDAESDLAESDFGEYFELLICCDKHKFKLYANGRHLFNFDHRYAMISHIRTLQIKGDVTLSYIMY